MEHLPLIHWSTFVQLELTDEIFIGLQLYRSSEIFELREATIKGELLILQLSHCGCIKQCGQFAVQSHFMCNGTLFLRLRHTLGFFEFPEADPEVIVNFKSGKELVAVSWHDLKRLMETRSGCIYPSQTLKAADMLDVITQYTGSCTT